MSMWPQYVTIAWLVIRFVVQVTKDMEESSPREMWIGCIGSVLSNVVPGWVLYMGGFFKGM